MLKHIRSFISFLFSLETSLPQHSTLLWSRWVILKPYAQLSSCKFPSLANYFSSVEFSFPGSSDHFWVYRVSFFFKLNLLRWHWLRRLWTFQGYNSIIHHLCIAICAWYSFPWFALCICWAQLLVGSEKGECLNLPTHPHLIYGLAG